MNDDDRMTTDATTEDTAWVSVSNPRRTRL